MSALMSARCQPRCRVVMQHWNLSRLRRDCERQEEWWWVGTAGGQTAGAEVRRQGAAQPAQGPRSIAVSGIQGTREGEMLEWHSGARPWRPLMVARELWLHLQGDACQVSRHLHPCAVCLGASEHLDLDPPQDLSEYLPLKGMCKIPENSPRSPSPLPVGLTYSPRWL